MIGKSRDSVPAKGTNKEVSLYHNVIFGTGMGLVDIGDSIIHDVTIVSVG